MVLWSAVLLLGGAALVLHAPEKAELTQGENRISSKKWRVLRRTPFFAGRLSGGVEIREKV